MDDNDWRFPSEESLGVVLRIQREKAGISLEQIAEIIRVRLSVLEALENEEWDRLPPAGFVRGFVRSYANVLGLDGERLLRLYWDTVPKSYTAVPTDVPEQKGQKGKTSHRVAFLIIAGLVLLIGGGVYFWQIYGWPLKESEMDDGVMLPMTVPLPAPPPITEEGVVPPVRELEERLDVSPLNNDATEAPDSSVHEPAGAPLEAPEEVLEDQTPPPPPAAQPAGEARLSLKAHVRERTWIRVLIDDQPAREYDLRPDSQIEWRGSKGFELLIGNAGGLALEFEGKMMENLGKRGQVIRMSLPEGYERSRRE